MKPHPLPPPRQRGGGLGEELSLDRAAILNRLDAHPVELREQVLAKALLEQMDRQMQEMLSRALVFELPVPKAAIMAVCESIPNLEQQINRAVALGLLEVSPDESLRVPRILPLKLPEDGESLYRQGAEVLYRLWYEEAKTSIEEQWLEIHRLALRGKADVLEDFDKALNYLQQSLEIAQLLQSPEAENLRQMIARVQQLADNR